MAWSQSGARIALLFYATAGLWACQSAASDPDVGGEGGGGQAGADTSTEGGAGGEPSMTGTGGSTMSTTGGTGGTTTGGAGGAAMPMGGMGGGVVVMGGKGGSSPVMGTCPTAAMCDDFEAQPVGQSPGMGWTKSGSSKLAVAEDRAFSGKRAVKIEIASGDGGEALLSRKDTNLFPVKSHLYMRMMVYLDRAPSGSGLHWAFMQAQGASLDSSGKAIGLASYGVGGHPSQFQSIYLLPSNNGLNDCWDHSSRNIPTQKWVCMEWHLDVQKDAQEVWADGQAIPELTFTGAPSGSSGCLNPQTNGKWLIPDLTFARVGWINYHTINGMTLWIDDVAMDTKRVGCAMK